MKPELTWTHETDARWDDGKARIVGKAPKGALPAFDLPMGAAVPGDWWRVDAATGVAGYGWLDQTWNGAEILLAVAPEARGHGVGTWILDRLELEAAARGLNYMFNVVRPTHPDRAAVTAWLEARGFSGSEDGDLRRRVRPS